MYINCPATITTNTPQWLTLTQPARDSAIYPENFIDSETDIWRTNWKPEPAHDPTLILQHITSIKKMLLWFNYETQVLITNSFITPPKLRAWYNLIWRNDLRVLLKALKIAPKYKKNLTFKRKSKQHIKAARTILRANFYLKNKHTHITQFARQMAQTHNARLITIQALNKSHTQQKYLQKYNDQIFSTTNVIKTNLEYNNLTVTQYKQILKNFKYEEHELITPETTTLPSNRYLQDWVFSGLKKRRLKLRGFNNEHCDIARRTELDLQTLTLFNISHIAMQNGDKYAAHLHLYWNFMHAYNWKHYY